MEKSIGSILRRTRRDLGFTIKEVATATHTSPASFSAWENDQSVPSKRSLQKLSEFYHVSFGESDNASFGSKNQSIEELLAATTFTYQGKPLSHSQQNQIHTFLSGYIAGLSED